MVIRIEGCIMITIKCNKCKSKIFKYNKIGKGRILKIHYSRIHKDFSLKKDDKIMCISCNNLIGIDMGSYIKIKADSFTYCGHKLNS
jgi:DNA-directed RNA polymerase subunit RPC12/RpoP